MAADPFVAPELDDRPRQSQNLAPGVSMPPARPWVANRPGDSVETLPDIPPGIGPPPQRRTLQVRRGR